ncbi:hypothetical protein ACVWXO_010249 [Bradyrhizobium sp. LM2.7]
MALHEAPFGNLDIDPRLLNRVGIGDGDAGEILRELADLRAGPLRLVQTLRASLDIVVGKRHGILQCVILQIVVPGIILNMLSECVKHNLILLHCKHFAA